jgi:hypothetical protein
MPLPVPQPAGCKSVPGIDRIVLFEGLLRLILQLLELAGQGGTLSGAAGAQLFQRSQTGFQPQRRNHL